MGDLYDAMQYVDVIGELCARIASRLHIEAEVHTFQLWNIEQAIMHRIYDDAMYEPALLQAVNNG